MLMPIKCGDMPLRQQIFEYIRSHGSAARAEITQALDISAGSVTTLTADLIAEGVLQEIEDTRRATSRGRPRVALRIVPQAAYVIGIKLAFNKHSAILADFTGNIVATANVPSDVKRRSTATLFQEIDTLIALVLSDADKPMSEVKAVGLGLPGIIDHDQATVTWSSLLTDGDQDLPTEFKNRYGVPLFIDNDTNMLALAEQWFGEGRDKTDFAVVTIENGVGMGLVSDGQLYRGSNGMGLELGHTKVQMDGALCRCGQRGCLEAYLGAYALTREAITALDIADATALKNDDILETLLNKAKAGDRAALAIFKRAGRYLSVGLANVIQLFDPPLIIVAGDRMQHEYPYAEAIFKDAQDMTLSTRSKPCQIHIRAWDDRVWARGATALALSFLTETMISGHTGATA